MSHFLSSTRLYLRQFTPDDHYLLYELDSDPEVMRYISKGVKTPLEVIQQKTLPLWLKFYEDFENQGYWALHENSTGDFIGWFLLRPDKITPHETELGYRLKKNAWGKGYATEMAKILVDKALNEWEISKVTARTLITNRASQNVMQKTGLTLEEYFIYPETTLPDWTEEERQAVKYSIAKRM